ncbi:MAG: hypothetical protein LC799_29390, partial [Actinobacteria bacterium]|nr:hypothetical protein [Actinomycetota bacterium]
HEAVTAVAQSTGIGDHELAERAVQATLVMLGSRLAGGPDREPGQPATGSRRPRAMGARPSRLASTPCRSRLSARGSEENDRGALAFRRTFAKPGLCIGTERASTSRRCCCDHREP